MSKIKTEKQFLKQVKQMLSQNDFYTDIDRLIIKAYRSSALNTEDLNTEDFTTAGIVAAAVLNALIPRFQPWSKEAAREVENLNLFI